MNKIDIKPYITTSAAEIVSCFVSFVITPTFARVTSHAIHWIIPEILMLGLIHLVVAIRLRRYSPRIWLPSIGVNVIVLMILNNINQDQIIYALSLYGIDSRYSSIIEQPLGLPYWGDSLLYAILIFSLRMIVTIPMFCLSKEKTETSLRAEAD